MRRITSIPGGIAHYVVGSVYLMAHLVTHERRSRELLEHVGPAELG
ncbi:MAG TPA: hypothetical protein RMH99_25715 [Sandaracinaceae bacterium LLY-WYZ-13_1]|nr:hypothetical protein [Sandaracinaceae bacterium LLY-WYZ-13_1]